MVFIITITHSHKAARLHGALCEGMEILVFFPYKAMDKSNCSKTKIYYGYFLDQEI